MGTRQRQAAKFLLAITCSVGAMEVAARLAHAEVKPFGDQQLGGESRYQLHDRRFYTLASQFRTAQTHAGRYATGDWPYRGEPAQPRPPGLLRVAVYGESIVYGLGLDNVDTLSSKLSERLRLRGLGLDQVQVLNLGVSGYSSVQVHTTVDETIDQLAPDVVILHVGAWNDQIPAVPPDDATRLAEADTPRLLTKIRAASSLVDGILHLLKTQEQAPAHPRVSPEELARRVSAIVQRASDRGAFVAVLSPAHRPEVLKQSPRTSADSRTVSATAQAAGADAVLSGQRLLDNSGSPLAQLFLDSLHPSPTGIDILAEALARSIAPELSRRVQSLAASKPPLQARFLSLSDISPTRTSSLGDVRLGCTVSRNDGQDFPLPKNLSATLGGAVLLDLSLSSLDPQRIRVEGTVQANGISQPLHLVVRTAYGSGVIYNAVTTIQPMLTFEAPFLIFTGRPGDSCRVQLSFKKASQPLWTRHGAGWLDPTTLRDVGGWLIAGPDGTARRSVAPYDLGPKNRMWVQGLVHPGNPKVSVLPPYSYRWTNPCMIQR
ncbi:MAG: lysophospholipase L1-like esterase [Pseudohongiellaceae bacterium]|jgi:lysophospholipase L1-like esterase